uniref:TBC domain-containing protein kinase-like protein n=2 Tax=Timema TaxID=61471 RepID=A0A7R9HDJ2_TIMPO|nr:unnamed protein product [Timema poppensis]
MTGGGTEVLFPIGHPKYTAPEVHLSGLFVKSGPKVDIWSLGFIVAELALGKKLWVDLKLSQCIRKVISLLQCDGTVLERLAREHNCWETYEQLPSDLKDFIGVCLNVSPKKRLMPRDLLSHVLFQSIQCSKEKFTAKVYNPVHNGKLQKPLLSERKLQEIYYLWQLAGGDVQSELKKQGLIRTKAPILSLPTVVLLEGTLFGQVRDQTSMLDLRVVPLPLDNLYQRLAHLPATSFYPLVEIKSDIIQTEQQLDAATLPLIIRERDTEYQFHRVVLYDRLLMGYPYKKASILKEARKDVPPIFRGDIWAALLEVAGNMEDLYISIDKETPTHMDRQIEVDIPRCHQYDELLSSCEGHKKFKRVLKAWVVSHPQYVYWQGLDSLCAPFLFLNFNKEYQAYACFSAFIPKYLHNFFLKDNSAIIQEYLAKFSHLIVFHDPALANHLASINFIPELFAIPWFLTMFSHVFPLHKIFHLWDKLLLGDASFPLYIGLSILEQLRDTLLESGFNECILLFSDLPEIDIERCVTNSIELYCSTPRSVTYRQHELSLTTSDSESSQLEISPITVAELQSEFCPRISAADVLDLLDMNHAKFSRPKVVVVDIRPPDEFHRGAVPGSINIPYSGDAQISCLTRHKGKIMVVAGSGRGPHACEFSRRLVSEGFSRVCTLHKGVQVLRSTNILVVPNAM